MEAASSVLRSSSSSSSFSHISSSKSQLVLNYTNSYFPFLKCRRIAFLPQNRAFPRSSGLRASAVSGGEVLEKPTGSLSSSPSSPSSGDFPPKIDKSGRLCSPRAARELALLTIYAACLEGTDAVLLFEKRMNIRREPGYEFDKTLLTKYNPTSFGGPPVTVETNEEADELLRVDEAESTVDAEVLSAPPKLVYSKLILRFTKKLLVAVVDRWNNNTLVINKVAPVNWKNQPAGRILELSILHLAMSEITVLGTSHKIVINEAVDIAKRFCDGAAPRIVNGCLRTFVNEHKENGTALGIRKQAVTSTR